jgi:hypothetical protein
MSSRRDAAPRREAALREAAFGEARRPPRELYEAGPTLDAGPLVDAAPGPDAAIRDLVLGHGRGLGMSEVRDRLGVARPPAAAD